MLVQNTGGGRSVQMQPSQSEIEHHLSKIVTTTISKCIEIASFEGDNLFSDGKNKIRKPSLVEKVNQFYHHSG